MWLWQEDLNSYMHLLLRFIDFASFTTYLGALTQPCRFDTNVLWCIMHYSVCVVNVRIFKLACMIFMLHIFASPGRLLMRDFCASGTSCILGHVWAQCGWQWQHGTTGGAASFDKFSGLTIHALRRARDWMGGWWPKRIMHKSRSSVGWEI